MAYPSKRLPLDLEHAGMLLLLAVVVVVAYLPALRGAFVWDDQALVADNLLIRSWAGFFKLWSGDITSGAAMSSCFYRPLQMVSYLLDYSFWRLQPAGFHLTSCLLHGCAAATVYVLIRSFWPSRMIAWLGALLFALHPAQTEAVAYISGRADILCALGVLWAMIFFLRFERSGRRLHLAAACAAFAGALFSKEYGLVFLPLAAFYQLVFRRRPRTRVWAGLVLVAVCYLMVRAQAVSCAAATSGMPDFWQRLAGFSAAVAGYARIIVVPLDLHMAYGMPLFSWSHPRVIAGIALAVFFLAAFAAVVRLRRAPEAFFLGWIAVAILPQSNLYPVNAFMAEHWLYLPLVGICALVSRAAVRLLRVPRFAWPMRVYLVLLLGLFATLTWRQAGTWTDPVVFFERAARFAPRSFDVQIELGRAYLRQGRLEPAIGAFSLARQIDVRHPRAYSNLAEAYALSGDQEQAETLYRQAITLDPGYDKAYINLGVVYEGRKEYARARAVYLEALRINPRQRAVQFNLGNVYLAQYDFAAAAASYRRALELDPDYGPAWNNLAIALIGLKEYREAISACDRAAALGVDNPRTTDVLRRYRDGAR